MLTKLKPELDWGKQQTGTLIHCSNKLAVFFQKLLKCALSLNCYYSTWQINPKKITINKFYAPCAHCNITYESQKQKKLHKPPKS